MRRLFALLALAFVFAAFTPSRADALLCSALTGCSCTVNATDMSFGNIQPLTNTATTATSDVQVSCTGVIDVAPLVYARFSAGTYGVTAGRRMQSASGQQLGYNLYSSNLYATILGDGTGGFPMLGISGGLITLGTWSVTATVYGQVPAAPTARPGTYTDTVTVRIDW